MQSTWQSVLSFVMVSAGLWPLLSTSAADIRHGEDVVIKAEETIEGDLYAFGRRITIDGTVDGDVVAFGEQITINGTVKGHVMGAGQTVVLAGATEGARIAGQVLKLGPKAKVDGDILAAGYSLECDKESAVSGDALYAGFQALFAGQIDKRLCAALVNCRLEGTIGGDVDLHVGGDKNSPPPPMFGPPPPVAVPSVPGGLTIADSAAVDGNLTYESPQEAKIDPQAKLRGEVEHRKPAPHVAKNAPAAAPQNPALAKTLDRGRHAACVAIVGLVVLLLFPQWSGQWADNIRTRPAASFLGGIVGLIAFIVLLIVAVIAIILAAILLGMATLRELVPIVIVGGIISYAVFIVGFWLLVAFLAEALAGLAIGRLGLTGDSLAARIVALVMGVVVVGLLLSIPYAGPWLGLVVMLFGFGGFCLWLIGLSPIEPFPPHLKPVPAK